MLGTCTVYSIMQTLPPAFPETFGPRSCNVFPHLLARFCKQGAFGAARQFAARWEMPQTAARAPAGTVLTGTPQQPSFSGYGWSEKNLEEWRPPCRCPNPQVVPVRVLVSLALVCHDCSVGRADSAFFVRSQHGCFVFKWRVSPNFWKKNILVC